jgi:molecular chaperone GrpE
MMAEKQPDAAGQEPGADAMQENAATEAASDDAVTAGPDPATEPDPMAVLREEIEALEAELAGERDRLLRTVAEMDNLRKRTRREVLDARRFAQAELLRPLLEILDNFDRALSHAPDQEDATAADAFREGVELIAQSFRQSLRDQGVELIEAEGAPFDPAVHEAVGQQPAPDGSEAGTILTVVQPGYRLGDMVLRASRVIVAQ